MVSSWRTWLAHGVLTLVLCFAFGGLAAMLAYTFREWGQIAEKASNKHKIDWLDSILDMVVPTIIAALYVALGGNS